MTGGGSLAGVGGRGAVPARHHRASKGGGYSGSEGEDDNDSVVNEEDVAALGGARLSKPKHRGGSIAASTPILLSASQVLRERMTRPSLLSKYRIVAPPPPAASTAPAGAPASLSTAPASSSRRSITASADPAAARALQVSELIAAVRHRLATTAEDAADAPRSSGRYLGASASMPVLGGGSGRPPLPRVSSATLTAAGARATASGASHGTDSARLGGSSARGERHEYEDELNRDAVTDAESGDDDGVGGGGMGEDGSRSARSGALGGGGSILGRGSRASSAAGSIARSVRSTASGATGVTTASRATRITHASRAGGPVHRMDLTAARELAAHDADGDGASSAAAATGRASQDWTLAVAPDGSATARGAGGTAPRFARAKPLTVRIPGE